MAAHASEQTERPLTLVERKQRAARARIVEAADALFAERGFDAVSVTDIAERAEVGRTTFFRHFADKTEVVFAKEQSMFSAVAELTSEVRTSAEAVDSLGDALAALEPLVIDLCRQATADPAAYRRHTALVDAHEELRAREALKIQYVGHELARVLVQRDASASIATMAAQLALACYSSGRILAASTGTSGDLVTETRAVFRSTLAMHEVRADESS